jgi:hypothetical protein
LFMVLHWSFFGFSHTCGVDGRLIPSLAAKPPPNKRLKLTARVD